ncbi:MAG: hypothetical protein Q9210_006884, partial [Variospora velana]
MHGQLWCTRIHSDRKLMMRDPGDESATGVFLYASNSTIEGKINATEADTRISDHLPDNWNYLGCNSAATSPAFKILSWSGDMLSLQRCADYCKDYRYFGVKAGS